MKFLCSIPGVLYSCKYISSTSQNLLLLFILSTEITQKEYTGSYFLQWPMRYLSRVLMLRNFYLAIEKRPQSVSDFQEIQVENK